MRSDYNKFVPKDIKQNLKWRKAVLQRCADDPDFAASIYQACASDILFFINGFGWTYDPRNNLSPKLPLILYEYQEDAILEIASAIGNYDLLIEKSRDMGASWICVAVFLWFFLFKNSQSFLFVSRVENYVDQPGNPKSLFWKLDYLLDNLPYGLKPIGYDKRWNRRKMHIENPETSSVIDGESTTENVARGDRRTAILLDEFASVDEGTAMTEASRDATNCRIFNSTPKGIANGFYDVKQTSVKKLRLHWTLHPLKSLGLYNIVDGKYNTIDKEYWNTVENYEERMRELDEKIILRGVLLSDSKLRSPWYARECGRSTSARWIAQELDIDYLGSGGQFFDAGKIQEKIISTARPPLLIGDLGYDALTGDVVGFRENERGKLKLWVQLDGNKKPPTNHKIAVGVDVSAGTGASNSCGCGWDIVTNEKVFEYTNPRIRPEAFAVQMKAILDWFVNTCLIWESGGPGRQFGSRMIELGYIDFYLRQREEAISHKTTEIPGVAQTRETKSLIISTYRDAIESGEAINYSREALEDHLEYIYGPDGFPIHSRATNKDDSSGAKTNHGDRTMADSLAWKMVKYRAINKPKNEKPKIPYGSLAWRRKMREKELQPIGRELGKGWY